MADEGVDLSLSAKGDPLPGIEAEGRPVEAAEPVETSTEHKYDHPHEVPQEEIENGPATSVEASDPLLEAQTDSLGASAASESKDHDGEVAEEINAGLPEGAAPGTEDVGEEIPETVDGPSTQQLPNEDDQKDAGEGDQNEIVGDVESKEEAKTKDDTVDEELADAETSENPEGEVEAGREGEESESHDGRYGTNVEDMDGVDAEFVDGDGQNVDPLELMEQSSMGLDDEDGVFSGDNGQPVRVVGYDEDGNPVFVHNDYVEYDQDGNPSDPRMYDDEGNLLEDDFYDDPISGDEKYLEESDNSEDERRRVKEELQKALDEREYLLEINQQRQKMALAILELKRNSKRTQEEKTASQNLVQNHDQVRTEYLKTLDSLSELWERIDKKRDETDALTDRLTQKLDLEDDQRIELSESFKKFKRQIARDARFSRTGKEIKLKRILAFEAEEDGKDREVADVRLKHINLLNQLRQLDDQVKQKEELAEGLHLIDFEQLKIENQTLNEKIEERNDELHKLRKKTTTTVQVLTHIKEKLQFVAHENEVLQQQGDTLEKEVKSLRDDLTRAKHARDNLRNENAQLKQKQGFIGSDLLVSDFETRKGSLVMIKDQVAKLKAKHAQLVLLVNRARRAEAQHQRMLAKGGRFGTRTTLRRHI